MVDERTLRRYINTLDHMRYFFQELLEQEVKLSKKPANREEYLKEFTELKDMIASGAWPLAVPEEALVDTEEDKIERAKSILEEYMLEDVKDRKFLDYGCKDGHVVHHAAKLGADLAAGYDLKEGDWEGKKGMLTTNKNSVELLAPFDIVLMYDVLDHVDDPQALMTYIAKQLIQGGRVYIRCHPFCSRHATHIYREHNLAYIHLVCSEEELIKLGFVGEKTYRTLAPDSDYRGMFGTAGFTVVNADITTQPIEPFFLQRSLLTRRIAENYWTIQQGLPKQQMEIQFIDYVLEKQ